MSPELTLDDLGGFVEKSAVSGWQVAQLILRQSLINFGLKQKTWTSGSRAHWSAVRVGPNESKSRSSFSSPEILEA